MIAWIIAWDLILEYGVSVAAVANGWSGYFNNALTAIGLGLPPELTKGPLAGGIVNLPAFSIVLLLMVMLIVGVKESARVNAVMVCVKLLAITIFLAVAIFNINPENWTPFAPFGWFEHTADGRPVGNSRRSFARLLRLRRLRRGFNGSRRSPRSAARRRQRHSDIAHAFCTIIYVVVSGVLTGIVHYTELNVSSPVAFALQKIGFNWASALVATGVIAGLTTVMLVLYYALTRIITSVSRDGLLPPYFAVVNSRTQTPVRTTVITGAIMAIMSGFLPLGILAELVNIGTLAAFVLVCAGVISLRRSHPEMPRPFKMPGGIILPVLGVLSCGALILFLPFETHLRFIVWLASGW